MKIQVCVSGVVLSVQPRSYAWQQRLIGGSRLIHPFQPRPSSSRALQRRSAEQEHYAAAAPPVHQELFLSDMGGLSLAAIINLYCNGHLCCSIPPRYVQAARCLLPRHVLVPACCPGNTRSPAEPQAAATDSVSDTWLLRGSTPGST